MVDQVKDLLHPFLLHIKVINAHRLRNTHASVLFKRVSIYYVSERLGHSHIDTTHSYYVRRLHLCSFNYMKNLRKKFKTTTRRKQKSQKHCFINVSGFLTVLNKNTSQERFELPTDGLEGRCSILLSYWDMLLCSVLWCITSATRFIILLLFFKVNGFSKVFS